MQILLVVNMDFNRWCCWFSSRNSQLFRNGGNARTHSSRGPLRIFIWFVVLCSDRHYTNIYGWDMSAKESNTSRTTFTDTDTTQFGIGRGGVIESQCVSTTREDRFDLTLALFHFASSLVSCCKYTFTFYFIF